MKRARDIMTREVRTVTPETSLKDLARLFTETGVSGFPVVDADGTLRGVVTESDLIHQNQRLHIPTTIALFDAVIFLGSSRKLEEELRRMAATTVEEIMTPHPVTVGEDTPVEEVAQIMAERHIHTLPVLDDEGNVVGVIGKVDVIRAMGGG